MEIDCEKINKHYVMDRKRAGSNRMEIKFLGYGRR